MDVHITASPALAVVLYYEKGENVIDGKPQPVNIRATTTFRREGGRWEVIGHHTDTLAYLQSRTGGETSRAHPREREAARRRTRCGPNTSLAGSTTEMAPWRSPTQPQATQISTGPSIFSRVLE